MDKNGFHFDPARAALRTELDKIDAKARAAGVSEAELQLAKARIASGEPDAHLSRAAKKMAYRAAARQYGGKHNGARTARAVARIRKLKQQRRRA